jgi:Tol biopolymer transport system component
MMPSRLPFRRVEMQALTTSGDVMEAAISPDGRYLARISARGDGQAVSLRHLRTGSEVQVLSVPRVAVGGLQFSRDGDYLYYTHQKQPSGAVLYRVPSLGGSPEIVLDGVDRYVAVSPDGRHFAWSAGSPEKTGSIIVAGPDAGTKETLYTWKEPEFIRPEIAWSPDARLLAVPIGSVDDRYWQFEKLLLLPLDRSSPKILWPVKWGYVHNATWLPDGKALLVNTGMTGRRLRIWVAPYPAGEPWETTNDLNDYFGVSVTSDSSAFVTVQQSERGEMWTTVRQGGAASQLTQTSPDGDGAGGIVWSLDGRLIYTQSGSGTADIWISNGDRTSAKRLTFGGVAIAPEISPDGHTIYFGAERGGMCRLWRMNIDGSNASQVTHGRGEQGATVSPDGKWLVYEAFSLTGPPSVWKMALPAGTPEKLGNLKSMGAPSISPDGQWLAVSYSDERIDPASGTALMHLDGTGFRPLIDVSAWVKWSPDGRSVYFVKRDQGVDSIWKQAIAGGAPVRSLTSRPVQSGRSPYRAMSAWHFITPSQRRMRY